MRNYGIDKKD
jgi:hypothetical protein